MKTASVPQPRTVEGWFVFKAPDIHEVHSLAHSLGLGVKRHYSREGWVDFDDGLSWACSAEGLMEGQNVISPDQKGRWKGWRIIIHPRSLQRRD